MRSIDEGDEGAASVVATAEDSGVSQGMVSYYFQTRENLVAEAQAARLMATHEKILDGVQDVVTRAQERRLMDAEPIVLPTRQR